MTARKQPPPADSLIKKTSSRLQSRARTGIPCFKMPHTPEESIILKSSSPATAMDSQHRQQHLHGFPIIAGQKVFIATTDDNIPLNTFVCAFDFNSGKLLWKFRTANSVKNTIAYENGIVIAQDAACNLYALDAESGKLLWKQYIKLNSYPYLTEGITIDKGVVYAGIGAGLSAYDLKDRTNNMD